jgi:hypothetical protein
MRCGGHTIKGAIPYPLFDWHLCHLEGDDMIKGDYLTDEERELLEKLGKH